MAKPLKLRTSDVQRNGTSDVQRNRTSDAEHQGSRKALWMTS